MMHPKSDGKQFLRRPEPAARVYDSRYLLREFMEELDEDRKVRADNARFEARLKVTLWALGIIFAFGLVLEFWR